MLKLYMFKKLFIFLSFFFFSAVPAFACTSVAIPDTVQVNTSTPVSILVSSIIPEQNLVGFNCDSPSPLGCTVSNLPNLSVYSLSTNNSTYGNWSRLSGGTSNLTIGGDFLFTSTGDKTFDVYSADDSNGTNQNTCQVTLHVVDTPQTPPPTPSCTSVATPDTIPVNSSTPVSIAVTNINPVRNLVGFNCYSPSNNGCTISNLSNISGYSITSDTPNYANWIKNDGSRTSNLTLGANFLFTSTGDKTFDVYGADDNLSNNQITCPVTLHVVAAPNNPPTVNSISNATINEGDTYTASGSFTDPDSTSWTATVDYGDGGGAQSLTLSGTNFSLSHVYKDNGTYTVTVSVTDNQGATGTGTATITVNNVVPTVGVITAPSSPVLVSTAITASANFTDPGVLDTHTASWNWGDGNTTTGTVTESNGSGSVSNNHTYTATGVYTITLTVTDKDGGVGTSTYQYVAVYDSSTSFAGGRSFDNPSSASPNTTGKVSFGISSKYSNSNTLTGNVKMNFKAASIDFVSTSLSSLATSTGKAYLKGNGTVNGSGNYTFLATGIDGSVVGGNDLIRFQIKDSSNNVIYDSQPGAGDTTDPTTSDATGNIRVH